MCLDWSLGCWALRQLCLGGDSLVGTIEMCLVVSGGCLYRMVSWRAAGAEIYGQCLTECLLGWFVPKTHWVMSGDANNGYNGCMLFCLFGG